MASHLEKAIQLNYQFHIRPTVKPWNAQGGRWTENLGTYTWAGLRPTLRTNYLLHHYFDGKNRVFTARYQRNWVTGCCMRLHRRCNPILTRLSTAGRACTGF